MRVARSSSLIVVALVVSAACTEQGGGGGGGGNSRVVTIDVPVMGGSPCFDGPLSDVDDTTPGEQYDCTVSDFNNYGMANQVETVLPACNNTSAPSSSTNKPCWTIVPDAMTCTVAPNLALKIERIEAPSASLHVIASCVAPA
jgi:hypothetical protein